MLSPEELLEFADDVRLACEGESLSEIMERFVREAERGPYEPLPGGLLMPQCGCPLGTTCMNVMCPHRVRVTCGPGWPD